MARDEREVITKAELKKQFMQGNLFSLKLWTALWIPVHFLVLFFYCIFPNRFLLLLFVLMLLTYFVGVAAVLWEHRRDKKDDLLFIKDKLVGMVEDECTVRRGRHYYTESAFYFADHDRVVTGRSDIRLANYGDEFLLVVRESRPDEVLAYYNLRFYRPERFD